ncbi:hypothetical protein HYW41_04955 [Candidatus Daviesbacteria bacterium]|nr:hypothetical protein [Candidatus Daviesbacteria bacterium]
MWVKILLIFFVFAFSFRTDHSFDQDLGRHLKLGEIIVKTGNIPKINLFSYTNTDFPFINTHWLFEVMAYEFSQTIGLQTLLVLKVVIFLVSVLFIFKIIPKKDQALLLPIGFIFLHVLRERLELRPEIFSFLFTVSIYYILEKYLKTTTKLIFFIPLIQLIWVNTHIYFFIGLLLQVIFLIHMTYQYLRFNLEGCKLKIMSLTLVLSVLVSLVNPHGLNGLFYPLNVTKNYGYSIVENQTMFLLESINFKDPNFLFAKLSACLVILSLLVTLIRRRFGIKNILLSLSGVVLALMNVRSFPYLIFLSLPSTLENFSLGDLRFSPEKGKLCLPKPPPRWNVIMNTLAVVMLLIESFWYLSGDYYKSKSDLHQTGLKYEEHIKGAMDFMLAKNLAGPIFNNFDIGSYIIYRGYPKYKVFVDGRPEAYPKEFFLDTYIPMQSDYSKFKLVEEKFKFQTVVFSRTDQTPWGRNFLQSIIKDPTWKVAYFDDFMLVFVKTL